MNTDLHQASQQWVGVFNGEMICHTGIIQFPMRKGWKRVHRLVVLPDYQGIGIGMQFVNTIAKHYSEAGWRVNLATTTPAMVGALRKSAAWDLNSYGRLGNSMVAWKKYYGRQHIDKPGHGVHYLNNKSSKNRITFSFNYNIQKAKK